MSKRVVTQAGTIRQRSAITHKNNHSTGHAGISERKRVQVSFQNGTRSSNTHSEHISGDREESAHHPTSTWAYLELFGLAVSHAFDGLVSTAVSCYTGTMSLPLQEHPYLTYYLQDILFWYRNGSAGGSRTINSHMKNVRIALKEALKCRPPVVELEARTKPVCFHLDRAVDNGLHGPAYGSVRMLSRIASSLSWGYGYERMPRNLDKKYAYSELMGPNGLVRFDRLILGVVLLAPNTTYPAHSHAGITESYLCLSGTLSQNDAGVYAPGSMIYNPPEHSHRITTDRREPCLLSYAWAGSEEALANQNMTFKRC